MTDKRFKPNYDGRLIIDTMTGDEYEFHSGAEEPVIELLNKIYEEVEIGKEYCKVLETDLGNCADARIRLHRENEQLKSNLKDCHNSNHEYYVEVNKLIRLCEEFHIDWRKVIE